MTRVIGVVHVFWPAVWSIPADVTVAIETKKNTWLHVQYPRAGVQLRRGVFSGWRMESLAGQLREIVPNITE